LQQSHIPVRLQSRSSLDWRIFNADDEVQKGSLLFVYLAITGARIEIPAAVSAVMEGENMQFLDGRGVIVAILRSTDVLMYSMQPIETDPAPPAEFSAK
jgi:hypothetical protein